MQTTEAEVTTGDTVTAVGEVLGKPGVVEEKPDIEEEIAEGVKGMPASVKGKQVIAAIIPAVLKGVRVCEGGTQTVVQRSQVIEEEMSMVANRMPNCAQENLTVFDKLRADSDRKLALANAPDNAAGICAVARIPAVACEIPELLHKLPAVDGTPDVVDEISDIVDEIPGVVSGISMVADGIFDAVDETSSAVDVISAVDKETPFPVEKSKLFTRPEDKTLLGLIERASPDPTIEFLKEVQSFSQAALDSALILACQRGFKYLVQRLVLLGADIECRDASGKTPLLICVENRYLELVHFLVAKRANIKALDYAGNNALLHSIGFDGSTVLTRFLLAQPGITINHQNKEGCTGVMKALEVRDVATVKLLLEAYRTQGMNEQSHDKHEHCNNWALFDQNVNCKGETSQDIAEKYGLGDVFKQLKECCYNKISPLLAAVESSDLEMVTFLLYSEITTTVEMDNCLNLLFRKHSENAGKAFTKNEMAIIKRLLECGVNVERHTLSFYTHSYMPIVSIAVEAGDYNLVELLCKHGAAVSEQWYERENLPLCVAAKHGRLDLIELLLKYKADVNTQSFSDSPLDCALVHGHIDCARFLLNHGANLDIREALDSAALNQSPEYMKFLFQNYQSKIIKYFIEEPIQGNNLFINAVRRGHQEITEQILQAGIDINKLELSLGTPIVESKNGEVAQFLINCGANVNHRTSATNETPLMRVLKELSTYRKDPCTPEVVQVLLENGASVRARNINGTTPLMMAARVEGHEVILQMLLEHGADCSDKDKDGNTALIHAIETRSRQNAMLLIQIMKHNTGLLNLQNNEGFTALMYDVSRGACTVMSQLIDGGADVNITDVNGNTALLLAATSSISENHLRALINAGCDVNHQNNDGLSALMLAVSKSNNSILCTLVSSGADVNAVSQKDASKTALSYLPKNHNHRSKLCIEALLDKGANASFLCPSLLPAIIALYHELIPKLIHCGLGPIDVDIDEMPLSVRQHVTLPSVSPLCLALLVDNVSIARYFWSNMFLTAADLFSLPSNITVRRFLQRNKLEECLSFLDQASSEPVSLFKMCLVAVTSAVGASPGREARVNRLPLPQVMKEKLLFKSDVESLVIPEGRNNYIQISYDLTDNIYDRFEFVPYPESEEDNSDYEHDSYDDYYSYN